MAREEVLGRIRDAEKQRRELEEEARKKKDSIIQKARLEAQKLVEDAASAGDAAAAERVAVESRKVQQERQGIASAGERETAKKRDLSRARLPQAAGHLVNEIVRQLDA